MIINVMVYYLKFVFQVLRVLGYKKDIKDKSMSELFDMVSKIIDFFSMYSRLKEYIKFLDVNEKVLKFNYEDVERAIKIFLYKIQMMFVYFVFFLFSVKIVKFCLNEI